VFAPIDAFVQRCRDLVEICEAQKAYGGKVQETESSTFKKLIFQLNHLEYDLLDVKVRKLLIIGFYNAI
jgi:hypothetical protein